MQAVLEVTAGPHIGRKIALTPGQPVRIGRTAKSDYVVAEDTFLSGAHFYVEWSGDQCVVRDLDSSNGTFLNGARLTESPMVEGDIVTAGQSSFALRLNSDEEVTAVMPAVPLDETRPIPLPFNVPPLPAAALPASAPPLPVSAAPLPLSAPPPALSAPPHSVSAPPLPVSAPPWEASVAPVPAPGPELSAAQRALLDVLRGLADPVFAVLDRSAASAFLDVLGAAGLTIEVLSETTGTCLVSVNADTRVAEQLAADGWGKAWGIYVTSHQQPTIVRKHLRRFQTLLTEDGAVFQFRFFNPALLRSFLPTLSADEARTLFGPISAILTEGASANELMLFMPGPSGVLEKTLPLTGGPLPGNGPPAP
jgi:hypothetical protein